MLMRASPGVWLALRMAVIAATRLAGLHQALGNAVRISKRHGDT
jgi:hypothetical protein